MIAELIGSWLIVNMIGMMYLSTMQRLDRKFKFLITPEESTLFERIVSRTLCFPMWLCISNINVISNRIRVHEKHRSGNKLIVKVVE